MGGVGRGELADQAWAAIAPLLMAEGCEPAPADHFRPDREGDVV